MRRIFLALFLIVGVVGTSHAQTIIDSRYKDWDVSTVNQAGQKTCYITSSPKKESGNYKKRGAPYLLVTYRGKNNSDVSVSAGYPYKEGSNVNLKFDNGSSYDLFTSPDTPRVAWAVDSRTDAQLIDRMKRGKNVDVRAHSRIGTFSKDTYSLLGFTKAFNRMRQLCR